MRKKEFGDDLFTDYVGDLMIKVHLTKAEARALSIDQLGNLMTISENTIARWVEVLQKRRLIHTFSDASRFLQFTDRGI